MMDEKELTLDGLQQAFQQVAEDFKPLFEAICLAAKDIIAAVVKFFDDLTRHLLAYRLIKIHIPLGISLWLSKKWPHRWLPYKWAWSMLL